VIGKIQEEDEREKPTEKVSHESFCEFHSMMDISLGTIAQSIISREDHMLSGLRIVGHLSTVFLR
jgi:hypothetical protein